MDKSQLFCPDWYGCLSIGIYAGPYLRIPPLAATRKTRLPGRTGEFRAFLKETAWIKKTLNIKR
ncbi:hypothetical protein CJJ18_11220 (plasmid) [Candidatus Williamhamiltonella defendens]|uniref:Uncharacterized protein n=1 Tax=Candidatus Williamhamiltonella defendens TaxID=138072 RepID=A0AAC9VKC3_9ENTR|nr:hypothetical protein CJJ18_11220 [Candidatus Hamiltonella defensa]